MALDFTVSFIVDRVSGNLRLTLTDTSDLSAFGNVNGFWKIEYPDGIFVENTDQNNPDFTIPSREKIFNLRGVNNNLILGDYKITSKIFIFNNGWELADQHQKTINFSFKEFDLSLIDNSNTALPQVSFKDTTNLQVDNYTSSSFTRTLSSSFPSGISASAISTANDILLMSDNGNYYEGIYDPLLVYSTLYTGNNHSVVYTKLKSFKFDIRRSPELNELVNLLNVLKEKLDNSSGQIRTKIEQAYQQLTSLYTHILAKTRVEEGGTGPMINEMLKIAYMACYYCFSPSEYNYSTEPLQAFDDRKFNYVLKAIFSFDGLNNVFQLPIVPLSVYQVFLNGVLLGVQDIDYSVDGKNITVIQNMIQGDEVIIFYTVEDSLIISFINDLIKNHNELDNLQGGNNTERFHVSQDEYDAISLSDSPSLLNPFVTNSYLDQEVPSHLRQITTTQISNWDTAYGWGDHALAGYLTTETDPIFVAWLATNPFQGYATELWTTQNFYPLNSNPAGYLTNFTETDPIFTAWLGTNPFNGYATETWVNNNFYNKITSDGRFYPLSSNPAGYLTSESDPVFTSSPAFGISSVNISNWNTAYGWGDHALAGYLTSASLAGYVPYTGATQNVNLGERGLSTGFVTFDTTPTNTPLTQGTVSWNSDNLTLQAVLNGYVMQIGEDQFYPVKNQTGTTIPKGTAVRFAGTLGNSGRLLIAPFIANGTLPSSLFMGVTAENIPNGEDGKVLWFGKLRGINTDSFNEGDILYASTTVAGGFQTAVPVAPNNIVQIAAVVTKSASVGEIFIRPQLGSNINNDEGVKITSPATGQLLQLQSSGLWENRTLAQIFGGTTSQYVRGDGSLATFPAIGDGTLTLSTSGIATGSQTFSANQSGNATFTVNVPGTNIAQGTRTATTVPITSSTGTGATLAIATTALAGVMSAADKLKLDGIAANANNYIHPTGFSNQPSTPLTGDNVISQITVNNEGHVTGVSTRAITPANIGAIPSSLLGQVNGVAQLDSTGRVPANQLPSYVDDVLEFTNLAAFPATGETGKIYVALDTNKTYRWSGSGYIEISPSDVNSVFGRTGVITAQVGDYSAFYPRLDLSYTNPSWINSLPWSKITDRPTTLSGYGITDAVPSNRTLTINGTSFDLSADRSWNIAAGVTSFNTRTGAVTLTSQDVTTALGYTPYNATNPAGYITSAALATYLPLSGGTMTGQITLSASSGQSDFTKGLRFPNDAFGGGGDVAGLRLYNTSGETMRLELYTGNDADDEINFATGIGGTANNNGVKINGNTIWNAGNFNPATKANTDQTMHIGTTALAINRASGVQTLTGVNIDGSAGSVGWENITGQRTLTRNDAGLQGDAGARSGFFETITPTNYYSGATSWQHLIEARHTNDGNNHAMQIAGSFFDQEFWVRKTNNNPSQAWSRLWHTGNLSSPIQGSGTTNFLAKFTGSGSIGNSLIFDNGTNILIGTTSELTGGGRLQVSGDVNIVLNDASGTFNSYGLNFRNNAVNSWSGLGFRTRTGQIAGYLLLRNDTANGNIYTPNGITLVADTGNLNLAARTTGGSIRFLTNGDIQRAILDATGNLTVSGDVIAFSSSDARLKDNLRVLNNSLSKINQLNGYSFTWNDKQDTYKGDDYGVVAQEVEALFPEMVTTRDNGYKAVKYEKLIPVLIEAVKELKRKVDKLS